MDPRTNQDPDGNLNYSLDEGINHTNAIAQQTRLLLAKVKKSTNHVQDSDEDANHPQENTQKKKNVRKPQEDLNYPQKFTWEEGLLNSKIAISEDEMQYVRNRTS